MSQPHSNSFASNPYGNYSNVQQEHGTNVGMMRNTQPLPQPRSQFQNLPADVKLPPSFNNARDNYNRPLVPPRSIHQVPHTLPNTGYPSYTNTAPVGMGGGDKGISGQSVGKIEIIRLLEETEAENAELKKAIEENNRKLDNKLVDLEGLAEENKMLKDRLSTSTNQFFEARVAVLGFKCRVMQLQAQGGSLPKQISPPQQLGPHEINAQVTTLKQDLKKMRDENNSLEAVIAAERDKLRQLEDKKKIVEEEKERFQIRVDQLVNEMRVMEDRLGEAQSHSYHEHSTRNQMSQQVRALEIENQELKGQLQALSQTNTTLQSRVEGLKASEKKYAEEAHKLQHATPVPKPRTNIQSPPASVAQDAEIERLRAEVQGLRKKVAEEKNTRSTVESTLSKRSAEYQDLMMKYNQVTETEKKQHSNDQIQRLSEELAQLKINDSSKQHTLLEKESMIQRMTAEKSELQLKVASLEKQKQEEVRRAKDDRDGIIANLEEKLRLTNATQSVSGVKSSGSSTAIARRLNDALGKVKELETKLAKQVANYDEDRGQWEREKQELQNELERLQAESGESIGHIVERLDHFEERTRHLEEKEASWTQEKTLLQTSLSQVQREVEDKSKLSQQLANLQGEFDEKSQEAAELQAQLDNVHREKESKASKLHVLSNEYSGLKENLQLAQERQKEAEVEKKKALEESRQLSLNIQQLTETLDRLKGEKKALELTTTELQDELTSLMPEYKHRTTRLHNAEAEVERLAMHSKQLQTELEDKTKRIIQVESQRSRIQERLTHMDVQLKAYQEDFERERQAREAAVKVKNMVEERIAKKEKEVKELRDRLNQQAMHTLNVEDQYEDSPDANQGAAFKPGRVRLPPSASEPRSISSTPPQGRSAEQVRLSSVSGGGEYHQRSQEQKKFSGTQPSRFSHEQEPPPPLPPREKAPVYHGYSSQPSGPGQHFQGGHGGGQLGTLQGGHQVFNPEPWTQQFPASTQSSGLPPSRARPMTTSQPGSRELVTAGSGEMSRMGGFQHQPPTMPPHQGGGYPPQPLDMGIRRPPERRNDFSDPPTPRNNFSDVQGRNNLDMPEDLGEEWVGPGEVINKAPPLMACPICGQQSFQTQTDLELHCAQCT